MTCGLKILNVVGARPNLPKIAPLLREMQRHPEITALLVHTGQHYDENLSEIFFHQMGIPAPQVNLEVGSGSHASQTAEILKRIEPVLEEHRPDVVVVVGDVNSTIAVLLGENTERPVTISEGTNLLVGTDPAKIIAAAWEVLAGKGKAGRIPPLWDGNAASRIVEVLLRAVPR